MWEYPRPPRVERVHALVRVRFAGVFLADSQRALRVLETGNPPAYYLPAADVDTARLEPSERRSLCEWKGDATYWDARVGERIARHAAWSYAAPWSGYEAIAGCFAFYAGLMDECTVGGMPVRAQDGDFYGGWVTPDLVGPFKGPPGTEGW